MDSRTGDTAIVTHGKPVNHILHLLLTIFTAGLWLFVWLAISTFGGERKYALDRMPDGSIAERQIGGNTGMGAKILLGFVALIVLLVIIGAMVPK